MYGLEGEFRGVGFQWRILCFCFLDFWLVDREKGVGNI